MNILIIAAHGSRKQESNHEVIQLSLKLAEKLENTYDIVEPAFLQFAEPLLEDQLAALAEKDPGKVVIFPFFIGSGSHILTDIPQMVEVAREKYPNIQFNITRHLGKLESIEDVIVSEVLSAQR